MAYTRHGRHITGTSTKFDPGMGRVCPPECFPCKNEIATYHLLQEKRERLMGDIHISASGDRSIAGLHLGNVSTGQTFSGKPADEPAPKTDYSTAPRTFGHAQPEPTVADDYPRFAKLAVTRAYRENYPNSDLNATGVYIVWFVKTLKNWFAMVSTTKDDGYYFAVRLDGASGNIIVQQYKKGDQKIIRGEELLRGDKNFEWFATESATNHYNVTHYPASNPVHRSSWVPLIQAVTGLDWKIVLQSAYSYVPALYEVTYDDEAGKVYVDPYELVSTRTYPYRQFV